MTSAVAGSPPRVFFLPPPLSAINQPLRSIAAALSFFFWAPLLRSMHQACFDLREEPDSNSLAPLPTPISRRSRCSFQRLCAVGGSSFTSLAVIYHSLRQREGNLKRRAAFVPFCAKLGRRGTSTIWRRSFRLSRFDSSFFLTRVILRHSSSSITYRRRT